MEHDIGPKGEFDASGIPDAKPVWEPLSKQGNVSPYEVRGVKYDIADVSKGYEEVGYASWYGLKFHGELTSNGEVYNMYEMSAAHKNLPLPSYVKVTNLENDRQIVVRVNDRGPFHKGRIIDLSYAAATKLGYANKGTAKVKIELIKPTLNTAQQSEVNESGVDKIAHFIQVAAFSMRDAAERILNQLTSVKNIPDAYIASAAVGGSMIHRVRVGPFDNEDDANSSLVRLKGLGFQGAQVIQRSIAAKNI